MAKIGASFADDVARSLGQLQADIKAAGSSQATVDAAHGRHYVRVVAAEEAWGVMAGALSVAIAFDPTQCSRGHQK